MAKGIILGAGRGSRMGDLTTEIPKGMVQLYGKSLFEWQIGALRRAGVDEICIVRGYQGGAIPYGDVEYRDNPRWQSTNMVSSLLTASDLLRAEECVVSYADIVYSAEAVRALCCGSGDIRITFDTNWLDLWRLRFDNPLLDAETFRRNPDGTLAEIGKRAQAVEEIEGQYMGLLYFTPRGWRQIEGILARLAAEEVARLDMTSLLGLLLREGCAVATVPYSRPWGEIDSLSDLLSLQGHPPLRSELEGAGA